MTTLLAYTPEQVCRITGLARSQLDRWHEIGLFAAQYSSDAQRFARMYSFRDVVMLKMLALLRKELPQAELRAVATWLRERDDERWPTVKLFLSARKVTFFPRENADRTTAIAVADVEREVRRASEQLVARRPEQVGSIVRNRYVQHNAWLVDGTRIPTSAIWNFHDAGYDNEEIQREYPRLMPRDIEAAISFENQRRRRSA